MLSPPLQHTFPTAIKSIAGCPLKLMKTDVDEARGAGIVWPTTSRSIGFYSYSPFDLNLEVV